MDTRQRNSMLAIVAALVVIAIIGITYAALPKEPAVDLNVMIDEDSAMSMIGTSSSKSSESQSSEGTSSSESSDEGEASSESVSSSPSVSSVAPVTPSAAGASMSAQSGLNPSKTVVTFYQFWVTYKGSALKAQAYAGNPYVSAGMQSRLQTAGVTEKDPFTCAVKRPKQFQVMSISQKGDTAAAHLLETFAEGTIEADIALVREDGMWKIDGVTCGTMAASSAV